MDGRGEGTHDQLSERRPPVGEVPRERGSPSSARDRPQQTPLLTARMARGLVAFHLASVGRADLGPVTLGRTISKTSCVRQYCGPPNPPSASSFRPPPIPFATT